MCLKLPATVLATERQGETETETERARERGETESERGRKFELGFLFLNKCTSAMANTWGKSLKETKFNELGFYFCKPSSLNSFCSLRKRVQ